MDKSKQICIDCGKKGTVERKRCKKCVIEYNKNRAKERYIKFGRHHYGISTCPLCNKEIKLSRKNQVSCINCRPKVIDNYNKVPRSKYGKTTEIRQLIIDMGIKIPKGFSVHHLDENPLNNDLSNLIIIPSLYI